LQSIGKARLASNVGVPAYEKLYPPYLPSLMLFGVQVLDGLDEAAERVEDMENWLNVFNVKLRHMREDIESVRPLPGLMQDSWQPWCST